jgi:hypothetical protein
LCHQSLPSSHFEPYDFRSGFISLSQLAQREQSLKQSQERSINQLFSGNQHSIDGMLQKSSRSRMVK